VWACSEVVDKDSCFGVLEYANGQVSQLPIRLIGVDILEGFTVDGTSKGFLLVGDSDFDENAFAVVTVDLNSYQIISESTSNVTLPSDTVVLDMTYDNNNLLALLQTYGEIPALNYLSLISINPKSAAVTQVLQFPTQFNIYFGSVYNSQTESVVVVLSDQGGNFMSYTIQVSAASMENMAAPYGIEGLAVYSTNTILGTTFQPADNQTSFVTFNPSSGNVTAVGNPFDSNPCGSIIQHAVLSPDSTNYFTVCCFDASGCLNSTLTTFEVSSGQVLDTVSLSFVQQPKYGLFQLIN